MWTSPDIATLYAATEATWPTARFWRVGGWALRDGKGGGKRVSAATCEGGTDPAKAESAMRAAGLEPLFMIRQNEDTLDEQLSTRGYQVIDPVTLYSIDIAQLAAPPPDDPMVIVGQDPLSIMAELWERGNISAPRLAVMARVAGPKAYFLGRAGENPAAVCFGACHGAVAMLHALEVSADARRSGLGAAMTRAVARWAQGQGARTLALMTTDDNTAANALYQRLGMQPVGHYHYRRLPKPE